MIGWTTAVRNGLFIPWPFWWCCYRSQLGWLIQVSLNGLIAAFVFGRCIIVDAIQGRAWERSTELPNDANNIYRESASSVGCPREGLRQRCGQQPAGYLTHEPQKRMVHWQISDSCVGERLPSSNCDLQCSNINLQLDPIYACGLLIEWTFDAPLVLPVTVMSMHFVTITHKKIKYIYTENSVVQ